MFTIVLIEPQIPPNTGNIARLCAATNTELHIVGHIGFSLSDAKLKRAGLDYWEHVNWTYFPDLEDYMNNLDPTTSHLLSAKATALYTERTFQPGDKLIFGSETAGIPQRYMDQFKDRLCTIPMSGKTKGIRCLNLATSTGIVLYEAIRQN